LMLMRGGRRRGRLSIDETPSHRFSSRAQMRVRARVSV
jgi:hypothetical protein